MIQFERVSKIYDSPKGKVTSLDRLALDVKRGEFIAIRGPSGCGKTTLLLAAGGMLRPSSGTVTVDGRNIYSLSGPERAKFRKQSIGFVFQMFHLVPYLNVLENVMLAADSNASTSVISRGKDLLKELGLASRTHHKPAELSTGERQRTAIARALLNEPKVILADEPTGNLDPDNASEVFRHLQTFHQAGGTVLLVTHGDAANAYADRVIQIRAGTIDQAGINGNEDS